MEKYAASELGNSIERARAPLFSYIYDNGSREVLHVSDGLCDLLELNRGEAVAFLSDTWDKIIHAEDVLRVQQALSRSRENKEPERRISYRLLLPKRETYIWVVSHVYREDLPDGRLLMYVSLSDITVEHEKNVQESARNARMNVVFEKILDTTQLAIFWKDKDRRFLGANKAFLDYYGFPDESVIVGKNDEDMGWHEDDSPYRDDEMWVLETGKSTYRVPGRCMSHGVMRDIVASKSPIVEHGKITGLVGTFEDVTQEKQQHKKIVDLNERLVSALKRTESANRAKTSFLSNVSHDMRTPLNGIMGFARLALETHDLEKAHGYLQKIMLSGELLQELINDTLELSRIANGRLKLVPEVLEARHMFDSLILTVKSQAEAKNINFENDLHLDELGFVRVDVLKVSKVLLNLLSNAVKFTPEGGRVYFGAEPIAEPHGNYCRYRFTVQDTGLGMNKNFLPRMFEPFEQEDRHRTPGSGLGLSIAKQLVELLGGTISVESEIDKGTTFKVELYLEKTAAPVSPEEQQKTSLATLQHRHILLCEDHPLNREIASTILESLGMKVLQAENGRIAVDVFSGTSLGSLDAVLMDIRMPEMDGLQAAKAIRKLPRKDAQAIPILALSANAFKEDMDRSKGAGMNHHLIKPIDPKQLTEELSRYIAAYDKVRDGWEELKQDDARRA